MKKLYFIRFAPLLLTFQANAEDFPNWYIGTHHSEQKITSTPDREFNTLGIIAGYQYNQYLALETRFSGGTSGYSHPFNVNKLPNAKYKEEIDTQKAILFKASYPIGHGFNIYALAGITKSKYEITTTNSYTTIEGNTTTTYPYIYKHSESGINYGIGLNYQLSESFNFFIDFQTLPRLKIDSRESSTWKSTSLGVNYTF